MISIFYFLTSFETHINNGRFREAKKLYNPKEIKFFAIRNETNFISFMIENDIETFKNTTNSLAAYGFLESLKYLHENNLGDFSESTME